MAFKGERCVIAYLDTFSVFIGFESKFVSNFNFHIMYFIFVCILGVVSRMYNGTGLANNMPVNNGVYSKLGMPNGGHIHFFRATTSDGGSLWHQMTSGENPEADMWHEGSYEIPSFYKNYSTLAALKSALHVADLQVNAGLASNDIINAKPGTYFHISGDTQHSPHSGSYFYCLCYGEVSGVRIILAVSTNFAADPRAYIGTLRTDSDGLTWKQITLT